MPIQLPKLKRGERYCIPCGRIYRTGFANNGAHGAGKAHKEAYERMFGQPSQQATSTKVTT